MYPTLGLLSLVRNKLNLLQELAALLALVVWLPDVGSEGVVRVVGVVNDGLLADLGGRAMRGNQEDACCESATPSIISLTAATQEKSGRGPTSRGPYSHACEK